MSILSFQHVSFAYRVQDEAPQKVLHDLSLDIEPGTFVALLGRNGSGKSTLCRMINGLCLPQSGDVLVNGLSVTDEDNLWRVRRDVGMVFQNPDNQIVASVVEEDVAFALENLGVPSAEICTRVTEALRAVDMERYRTHAPHRLSGGQKQRVAIAGVLAMNPSILVLDEPTAMLDPIGREEVLSILDRLRTEGVTVVLVTHHMEEAARADRVVILQKGNIELDAPPREVFAQAERLAELGLTLPAPAAFAREQGLSDVPLTIEECASMFRQQAKEPTISARTRPPLAGNNNPSSLELRDISLTYGKKTPFEKQALDNVSLTLKSGVFHALIGATGSGKSSLVRHLNGLQKPESGVCLLNGEDIWQKGINLRSIRFRVGLCFQYPEHQLFEQTVEEDIGFGPRSMGCSADEIRNRVHEAAAFVNLPEELLSASPFELSGGQKRRVALAGVIAMRPQFLVLDEPTAGLDPVGQIEIFEHIEAYRRETGAGILLVSHSMEDAAARADELTVLAHGRVFASGTPDDVFCDRDALRSIGLDVPAVRAICQLTAHPS